MRIFSYLAALLGVLFLSTGMAFASDGGTVSTWLSWITDNGETVLSVVAYVVTAATVVTCMTSTTSDNTVLNYILVVLNFLAGNFFKNTNADTLIAAALEKNAADLDDDSTEETDTASAS